MLDHLDVNGPCLEDFETIVVMFLSKKLSKRSQSCYLSERRYVYKMFLHVKLDDVDRIIIYDCEAIKGCRDMHSF